MTRLKNHLLITFWLLAASSSSLVYAQTGMQAHAQIATSVSVDGFFSSANYGSVTPIRGTVSPSVATGTISFYDGATLLGRRPVIAGGTASMYTPLLAPGKHSLWVRYNGDATYSPSVSAKSTCTINAQATTGFTAGPSISESNPYWVSTFDFTPDFTHPTTYAAVADYNAGNVLVYKVNPTTAVWTQLGSWAVGSNPTSIAVGDYNGDGYPDLAVSNRGANSVTILLGTFDNNLALNGFSLKSTISTGSTTGPQHVVAGDFNGDGVADLAVALSDANNVGIYLGAGDGTFTQGATVTAGAQPGFIAVADFNNDGVADLAVANANIGNASGKNIVTVYLGAGNGTFTGLTNLTVGNRARGIAVADYDGDGRLDLAIANFTTDSLTIYLQNASGTDFHGAADVTFPSGTNPWSILTTDFNGDGKADLIVTAFTTGYVYTFTGNGNGTFSAGPGSPFAASASAAGLAVGDFDGNGTVDIISGSLTSSGLNILLGGSNVTKTATGVAMTAVSGASSTGSAYGAAVSLSAVASPPGLSGTITFYDGVQILGTASASSGSIPAIYNLSPGTHSFTAHYNGDATHLASVSAAVSFTVTPAQSGGFLPFGNGSDSAASFVAPAYVSGSQPGYVALYSSSNTVKVWTWNGSAFTQFASAATGTTPSSTLMADFNGDQKPDIAVANYGDNTVTILLGDGVGGFTAASGSPVSVGVQPTWIASGDFNGDGIVDLAVANFGSSSNSITILLGNGNGTFHQASGSPISVGANPWSVTVADTNNDGKADLIVPNGSSSNAYVLLGNGDGTFTTWSILPTGVSPRLAIAADFTGDGRSDIAVVNYNPGTISVFLQNSTGTAFNQTTDIVLPSGAHPISATVIDFNGDNKPDLLISDAASGRIYVYLGNGDGTFQFGTQYTTNGSLASFVVEDLNGDGRPDVILANGNGSTIALRGATPASVTLSATPNPARFGQSVTIGETLNPQPGAAGYPVLITDNGVPVAAAKADQLGHVSIAAGSILPGARTLKSIYSPGVSYLPGAGSVNLTVNTAAISGFVSSTYGAGSNIQNAVAADFNGDGIPDYATANTASNNISVYQGGNGGFTEASGSPYADAGSPQWIVTGDFNNDGKADLAIANANKTITILLGSGNGTFTAASGSPFSISAAPFTLVVGDFNSDGIEDLAVAAYAAKSVLILQGSGTGTFTSAGSVPLANHPARMAVTDFNGDGNPDIVIASPSDDAITLLTGLGSNNFTASTIAVSGASNDVAVADFDGDGKLDIAVAGESVITLLRGNGAGSFTAFPASPLAAGADNVGIVISDFNADGKPDLAFLSSQQSVIILLNTSISFGSATFAAAPYSPFPVSSAVPNSLAVADFNGDGAPDLLTANGTNNVSVIRGAVPSSISLSATPNSSAFGSLVTLTASIAPSTVSGYVTFYDGATVLGSAFTSGATASFSITQLGAGAHSLYAYYAGNLTTLASTSSRISQTVNAAASSGFTTTPAAISTGAKSVATADINGDGKSDLVTIDVANSRVAIWLGNGNGGFTQATGSPYGVGSGPTSVAIADFNRDGRPDLAIANSGANTLSILMQNSDGSFSPSSAGLLTTGAAPVFVTSGDFNKDGLPDLAVANSTDGTVLVLLGDGAGGFPVRHTYATGSSPSFISVSDFNNDGNADLIVSNSGANSAMMMPGAGDGTFTLWNLVTVGAGPRGIATGDFNGDGKTDFATANFGANTISLYFQNNAGGFASQPDIVLPAGSSPSAILAGDFNGDGKIDLAISAFAGNSVYLYLGNGAGSFTAAPGSPFTTGAGPGSLVLADFNGDGTMDLAVGNQTAGSVSLLLGAISTTTTLAGNSQALFVTVTPTPPSGKVTLYNGTTVFAVHALSAGQASFAILGDLPAGINSFRARFDGAGTYTPSVSAIKAITNTPVATSLISALTTAAKGTAGTSMIRADMNSDGNSDIVVLSSTANTVSIYLNTGSNSAFTPAPGSPYSIPGTGGLAATPTAVAAADFNGDGRTDLAVADAGDSSITMFLQNADGSYAVNHISGLTLLFPHAMGAADFNGDGNADLVIASTGIAGVGTAFIAPGRGDGTFDFASIAPVIIGQMPAALTVADFNNDGRPDVAITNSGDGTVSLLLAQANGALATGFGGLLTTGGTPGAIVSGDFNSDGRPDLAVANTTTGLITVFTMNAAGTAFNAPVTIAMPGAANVLGLTATDFNGDGKADLAAFVAASPGAVYRFTANASGSFDIGAPSITLSGPVALISADWNLDGRQDLAALESDGRITLINGADARNLTFSISATTAQLGDPVTLSVSPNPVNRGTVTFYDGVSVLGVVNVFTSTGNSISLTKTLGAGSHKLSAVYSGGDSTAPQAFPSQTYYVAPGQSGTAAPNTISINGGYIYAADSLVSGDVNGDGILDFLALHTSTNLVNVYLGNRAGTFTEAPGSPFSVSAPAYGVTADFNGDGKLDLAITSTANSNYTIWFGDGSGRFTQNGGVRLSDGADAQPRHIVAADFNRDGRIDLAITNYNRGSVSVLLGDGVGSFAHASGSPYHPNVAGPSPLAVADFDNDGNPDIVLAGTAASPNTMPILYGSATGAMSFPGSTYSVIAGPTPIGLTVADFDGDGVPDVAASENGGYNVFVCCSNNQLKGIGITNQYPLPYAKTQQFGNLVAVDNSGDGYPDIALAVGLIEHEYFDNNQKLKTVDDNAVAWWKNTSSVGSPTFALTTQTFIGGISNGPTTPPDILAGDFNGDGLIDLVVSSPNAGIITFLPGSTTVVADHLVLKAAPSSAPNFTGAAIASITVEVHDIFDRVVTGSSAAITVAAAPQNPTGTVTANAVHGIASFGNLIFNTAGTYTLSASSSGLRSSDGVALTIYGPPAALAFSTQPPATVTHGVTLSSPVIQVQDANGNISPVSVPVTISSAPAGVSGTTARTTDSTGAATFGGLSIAAPGTYTLTATSPGLTNAVSSSFLVTGGPATHLAFGTVPSSAIAAVTMSPITVQLFDASDLTSNTSTATVTLSSNPVGLTGTVSAQPVNGIATFSNLVFSAPGTYTLTASASGITGVVSNSIVVTAGPATQMRFSGVPASVNATVTLNSVTVELRDANGFTAAGSAATVNLSSSPAGLAGTTSSQAVNGIATFNNLSFSAAGAYTLTAAASGVPAATSSAISVITPVLLSVRSSHQGNFMKGIDLADYTLTVTNNGISATTGTVTLTDTLPAGLTFSSHNPADGWSCSIGSSVATCTRNDALNPGASWTLDLFVKVSGSAASSMTNQVTVSGGASPSASATDVTFAFGKATQMVVVSGAYVSAQAPFTDTLSVAIRDANNVNVTMGTYKVDLALLGSSSSGYYSTYAYNNGVATFLLPIRSGSYTLYLTSNGLPSVTLNNAITGTGRGGFVSVDPVSLAVASQPSTGVAGQPLAPISIEERTIVGTLASASTDTVTLTSTPSGITGTTSIAATGGIAGFTDIAFAQPGTYIVTATSSNSLIPVTSATITVNAAVATTASLTVPSASTTFGNQVTLTATVVPSSATGHVTFYDGVNVVAWVPLVNGTAAAKTASLPPGVHTIYAKYTGDGSNRPSVSDSQTVSVTAASGTSFAATSPIPLANATFVKTAALSSSGQPYVLALNGATNQMFVYAMNTGTGAVTAAPGSPYAAGTAPSGIVVADFNGDGYNDAAIANSGSNNVTILLSTHDGSGNLTGFTPSASSPIAVGSQPSFIESTDFNQDGIPDLAVANAGDATVSILLGNGFGAFNPGPGGPTPVGANPLGISIADFNNDGVADLAVVSEGAGNVSVLLGTGDGSLFNYYTVTTGSSPRSVIAGDLDGDGNPDLVVASFNTNALNVYLQTVSGDGFGFTQQADVTLPSGSNPTAIAATDLNADGKLDLLVGAAGTGKVLTFSGNGAGSFAAGPGSPYAVSAGPGYLAIADLNADGRPDILSASRSGSAITVLLGQTAAPDVSVTLHTVPAGLMVSVDGGGAQVAPFTSSLTAGTHTIAVAATQTGAPGSQYVFTAWSDSGDSSHTITVGNSPATYTATFQTQYQLTTLASPLAGGSVTPASGSFYPAGATVNLQATANSGYAFSSWTGSVATSGSAATTVVMNGPQSVTASFAPQFVLNASVTPGNGGTITGTVGGQNFNCSSTCSATGTGGSSVTLTAAPASGYAFSSWTGCASTSGASCTVTLSGTVSVSATFTSSTGLTYTQTALTLNRTTGYYTRSVTVTNSGPKLSASAYVADGLPAGVSLVGASGVTSATAPAGSPYLELGAIGANNSVTVTVQFSRTGTQTVAYTTRILGAGPR